jgi:hypothetical protein
MATDAKLYGNIVAMKDDRSIIGGGSIVYLDTGFKDGIQRGQIFEAVRISSIPIDDICAAVSKEEYLADLWNKLSEGKTLYEFPVAKLRIVESRPDSSTAVILSASEDLAKGAFIKGFSWTEPPEFLKNLPSCVMGERKNDYSRDLYLNSRIRSASVANQALGQVGPRARPAALWCSATTSSVLLSILRSRAQDRHRFQRTPAFLLARRPWLPASGESSPFVADARVAS